MEPPGNRRAIQPGTGRRIPRWSKWLLAGLCLATCAHGIGNLPLVPVIPDGRDNVEMGVQFAGEGPPSNLREPFIPAAIAGIIVAQRMLGFEAISSACIDRRSGQAETLECRAAYATHKIFNIVAVLAAGISAFFLTLWFATSRLLPHAAFLLVSQSLLGLQGFAALLTEVPAAALLAVVSCLSVLTVVRRRVFDSALLGLALAALALTKVAFLPFAPIVAAALAVADLARKDLGKRTVFLVGVLLLVWFMPVGGWMVRNLVLFGEFAVAQTDSYRVQQVIGRRASYNTMRDDEFAAGFWYFSPYRPDLGIPEASYERFRWGNIDGFRRAGGRSHILGDAPLPNGLLETILVDPWQHFKVSALMAWRGVFPQARLGMKESYKIRLFRPSPLPNELSSSINDSVWWVAHRPWSGKDAYVVWFHEQGTIDAYGEREIQEFLNLEAVGEFANSTLYRVPRPENFVLRGPNASEIANFDNRGAVPWAGPGTIGSALRDAPLGSAIFTNNLEALPSLSIDVPHVSEIWGLGSWPRPGWRFDPVAKSLVNLAGFLALLVAPLWFWRQYPGRLEILFVPLPALYLHAVYAGASHFLPRYAEPEIPLRIWATLLLLCLVTALVHRVGSAMRDSLLRRGFRQARVRADSRTR